MTIDDAHDELRASLVRLRKARLSAAHQAVLADLQALHDHPDTHDHVRAAIAPVLAKHAPKPGRAPKPKPALDEGLVAHHASQLRSALGNDVEFARIHAEVGQHGMHHVHAVTRAFVGSPGRSKKESLAKIRSRHDSEMGMRARHASRDGRTAG